MEWSTGQFSERAELHVTALCKRGSSHHRLIPNYNLTTCLSEAHSGAGEAVAAAATGEDEVVAAEVGMVVVVRDRLSGPRRKTFST